MTMSTHGLQVRQLQRSFGGIQAIADVSFDVGPAAITGLIGPNGAGKTTTLNIISGHLSATSGRVDFAGRSLTGRQPAAIARMGISRTFQTPQVFPDLTVVENVMVGAGAGISKMAFFAEALGLPSARHRTALLRARALEMLERVGLAEQAAARPDELPFGGLRLMEFARAAAASPRLLLLDEPSSGLSSAETANFRQLIMRFRDEGWAILLVEHNMRLVMSTVDHVVVLDRGRTIAQGTPDEVRTDPAVQAAYLGSELS